MPVDRSSVARTSSSLADILFLAFLPRSDKLENRIPSMFFARVPLTVIGSSLSSLSFSIETDTARDTTDAPGRFFTSFPLRPFAFPSPVKEGIVLTSNTGARGSPAAFSPTKYPFPSPPPDATRSMSLPSSESPGLVGAVDTALAMVLLALDADRDDPGDVALVPVPEKFVVLRSRSPGFCARMLSWGLGTPS